MENEKVSKNFIENIIDKTWQKEFMTPFIHVFRQSQTVIFI